MFCTVCAALNPLAARHCSSCGNGLGQGALASPAVARQNLTRLGLRWPRLTLSAAAAPLGTLAATGAFDGDRAASLRQRLRRVLWIVPLVVIVSVGLAAGAHYHADQTRLAAAYSRGEAALATGRYTEAIAAFAAAGGYRDADARRATAIADLAPYRTAYLDGIAALQSGRSDEAIALLEPVVRDLPRYEDADAILAEARRRRANDLLRQVDLSETRRDWLSAERALSTLLADNPDDAALAGRLSDLRRNHAPILFTRDRALYLIGPDMADERLVTSDVPVSWPAWNPDRSQVAFLSPSEATTTAGSSTARLYVVDADGANLTELADGVQPVGWPVWRPDGGAIAYATGAGFDDIQAPGTMSVRVVDLATGLETDLTRGLLPRAFRPTWSPTGDRLAFISLTPRHNPGDGAASPAGEVYTVEPATGALVNVGKGRVQDAIFVSWSPVEDRLLIYERSATSFWYEPPRTAVQILDLATDTVTGIEGGEQVIGLPVWSPDGSRFAFVEGQTAIRVRKKGLGEAWINVPSVLSGYLTWSPDGTMLLAATADPWQPSYLIPMEEGLGTRVDVVIPYDLDPPAAGPPQWGALRLPAIATPSVGEGPDLTQPEETAPTPTP
ncbi:MAG: hypothetical protein M3Q71_07830 [Chloroflexota bacterium]|nr:hypothetical protein [Chloroflexota bacterium]